MGLSARLWPPGEGFGRIGFDSFSEDAYTLSPVVDSETSHNILSLSHTPNPGGYNVYVRGSLDSFNIDDISPSWELYVSDIGRAWRYIQLKVAYEFSSSSSSSSSSMSSSSSSMSSSSSSTAVQDMKFTDTGDDGVKFTGTGDDGVKFTSR